LKIVLDDSEKNKSENVLKTVIGVHFENDKLVIKKILFLKTKNPSTFDWGSL